MRSVYSLNRAKVALKSKREKVFPLLLAGLNRAKVALKYIRIFLYQGTRHV